MDRSSRITRYSRRPLFLLTTGAVLLLFGALIEIIEVHTTVSSILKILGVSALLGGTFCMWIFLCACSFDKVEDISFGNTHQMSQINEEDESIEIVIVDQQPPAYNEVAGELPTYEEAIKIALKSNKKIILTRAASISSRLSRSSTRRSRQNQSFSTSSPTQVESNEGNVSNVSNITRQQSLDGDESISIIFARDGNEQIGTPVAVKNESSEV